MEIVDELMTPGCPQCAVKHLSAALHYRAERFATEKYVAPDPPPNPFPPPVDRVLLARAYINLGEVLIGYRSHLWYAVGLLQRSEEESQCAGGKGAVAREARLILEQKGPGGVREAMQTIHGGTLLCAAEMEMAHLLEARRELPGFNEPFYDYADAIEKVRKEYFDSAEGTVPEASNNQGEPEMATKKAPAKKAVAKKAVQAACKGGKCKPGKSCKK